jgi:hypothetical protein
VEACTVVVGLDRNCVLSSFLSRSECLDGAIDTAGPPILLAQGPVVCSSIHSSSLASPAGSLRCGFPFFWLQLSDEDSLILDSPKE